MRTFFRNLEGERFWRFLIRVFTGTIELAVPWEELGVKPEEKHSIGLEIWNNDKDYAEGNYFYSGWTTDAANLKNPSEWGDIVFTGSNVLYKKAIAIVCVSLFGAAIFLIAKKR